MKALEQSLAQITQSPAWRRWQQLPARDRVALLGLGAFLLVILAYAFVWLPIGSKLKAANARYIQEREFYAYLQEQAPAVRQSTQAQPANLGAEQLQGLVTSSAQKHGLVLERLDNEGNGRLLIALSKTPFDALLRWLAELDGKGVGLAEASLERTEIGKVDARLTMAVKGG